MSSTGALPAGLILRPTAVHCRRLNCVVLLLTLAFAALVCRLFDLQVLRHRSMALLARKMLQSYAPLWGMRGDIRTSDGTLLAREVIEYQVAVDPSLISLANVPRVLAVLCRGLGLSDEERRSAQARLWEKRSRADAGEAPPPRFFPLKRGVPAGLVEELRGAVERTLPPTERRGVIFSPLHFRQYPRGPFLGAVVGAVTRAEGEVLTGAAGLELGLEATLAGRDGQRKLRCEGRRLSRWFWPGEVDIHPVHGYNATLTIDSQIQGIAEEELERGLEREKAAAGVAVVMDCRTGDILAMVNLPALDPSHYHDYPSQELDERRRNRAVESQYEPGSTLKPFIAALAMEKKLFGPAERISEGGRVAHFGRRRVEDVSDHGPLTLAEAVIFSSNIAMARVGLRLGREGLNEALDRFRFQAPTGIGLPGEALGKRRQRREWSETYTSISVSFGYEVMVTPIQLCAAFSSLVNGGLLCVPRVVQELRREGEVVEVPRTDRGRSISEETSRRMREVLREVVERGTARGLRIQGFPFGGKTGTTMAAGRNGYVARDYLSSFVAFAPFEEPRVVVLVMMERPRVRHYGSTVAGPVVVGILRRMFHLPEPAGERALALSLSAARADGEPAAEALER